MELLLELRFPLDGSLRRTDARVDIDPDDTIRALAEALTSHASRHGFPPAASSGVAVYRQDQAQALNPADRVVDTGLVSGEFVTLADAAIPPAAPRTDAPDDALTLDVAAGPEAGRLVRLGRGDTIVGRGDNATVRIVDPTLSRQHFALHVGSDGSVQIAPNPKATNPTLLDGFELQGTTRVELGQPIQAGSSVFAIRRAAPDATRRRDQMGQVPFNRVPYQRTVVQPVRLDDVAGPPAMPTQHKLSIAMALSPAISGVALVAFTQRYYFLAIAALSPLLFIYRHISNKRGGRKKYARERDAYYKRVEDKASEVEHALANERHTRLQAAPDLAELARQAMMHMPRLWERNRSASDILDLRVGMGEAPSQVSVEIGRGGDEDLRAQGRSRLAHHASVGDVPLSIDLVELGIVGAWGDPAQVASVGRALVAQAACLHSPEDLVIVGAVGDSHLDGFEWLKWLPHVRSTTSPLDGDHLAVGMDATRNLMVKLLGVTSDRNDRSDATGVRLWPRILFLLDEATEPDRALLAQLLDVAPDFGNHPLWMGQSQLNVPRQCRAVIDCAGAGYLGRVRYTDPGRPDQAVELDGADPSTARTIARALAPLRDASAASQTTAIPRVVPLLDAVGIDQPTQQAVAQRWNSPRPYGLTFPIGLSAEGPYNLDLVEQGPHCLIGGTSGAGKSELLQTLVLSLASNYPPTKLNFLFVDYKGGASSAEFRGLPHTVGYVTNLNGRLSLRALTSLRAELQRRMQLMEGKAKDLAEMLTVAPAEAPPSLVIVVDEFAALVKEIPDFMAGIVDIAQRGRSLGVHLILATQRPTGVVNDNILANTNLRISLRVLDPNDSTNIIGSRDAADIPVPLRGRGYARTGPHALVPFQCAWSGAPFTTETATHSVGIAPFTFSFLERRGPDSEPLLAKNEKADEPPTHLDVLVDACAKAAEAQQLPPVRRPWVEPLPDVIPLADVIARFPAETAADPGRIAPIGMYDDPENQAQHVTAIDLEASGGLIVFGTGGSGKTTLLRTVAAGLCQQGSPDEVRLYALDFASRALEPLADLPHCASVIAGEDVEQVTRLLTVLEHEIEQRRGILARARAETLGAVRAAGVEAGVDLARIIVLLDGYSSFHSTFDKTGMYAWQQTFQRIVSSGRQVGVHCVLTTERRSGLPSGLQSAISSRVALRMATTDELVSLGVPSKLAKDAELPNGRGFLDGTIEVQIASVSGDASGVEQSKAIGVLGTELAQRYGTAAPRLAVLPTSFAVEQPASQPLMAPLGLVDLTMAVAQADLTRQNLAVVGPPLSGKSTALQTVACGLRAATPAEVKMFAVGTPASPLAELNVWDDSAFSRAAHPGLVERISELLADDEGVEARVLLFIDAAEDIEDKEVVRPLEKIVRRDSLRLIVASEPTTISKAYSGWLSALRRNRSALVLQPESKADVESVAGIKAALRPDQEFPPGRGIYVANRQWQLVQVGLPPT